MGAPKGGNATSFKPGNPGGPGAPKLSEAEKWKRRMQRAVDYDYKQACRALLPMVTDQLADRVEAGEMETGDLLRAHADLRDSVHGKPAQTIQGPDGGPLVGTFTVLLGKVAGKKHEEI